MNPFELADSVRYLDDTRFKIITRNNFRNIDNLENTLALEAIKITRELTPELQIAIEEVCNNLSIESNKINAYINPSEVINAGCVNTTRDKCIITFTSPLVNLLTIDEIKFTVGHELGHFLLNHCLEDWVSNESQQSLIKKRAGEISCDRIGLLACKDISVSIKSMMKSLSGLSGKYLTYDMKSFLKQLEDIKYETRSLSQFYTHPAFLLRVKALLRFAQSDKYLHIKNGVHSGGTPIETVDKQIQTDLNKYVDSRVRDDIAISKVNVSFWAYVFALISDGNFTKKDQQIISNKFGSHKLDQLSKMLKTMESKTMAINEIREKLFFAINSYKETAPNNAKEEINIILIDIEKETNQKDIFSKIFKDIT